MGTCWWSSPATQPTIGWLCWPCSSCFISHLWDGVVWSRTGLKELKQDEFSIIDTAGLLWQPESFEYAHLRVMLTRPDSIGGM